MTQELFDLLESDLLSAELNAASGLSPFLRGLDACEAMRRLREEGEPEEASARLSRLLEAPFDAAYENPADVAVAALLRFLQDKDEGEARRAAEAILGRDRNFWWATHLAAKALEAQPVAVSEPQSSSPSHGSSSSSKKSA